MKQLKSSYHLLSAVRPMMALGERLRYAAFVTIFGYNTDIRHGDTVFHVQTEVRENELTMQSAIFVRGRCIGKHSVSYAAESQTPDFDEHQVHRLVTQQHRFVVNTIREGRLDALLAQEEALATPVATGQARAAAAAATTDVPSTDAQPSPASTTAGGAALQSEELTLEWMPESVVWAADHAVMRIRVMLGDRRMQGAQVISRIQCVGCEPAFAQGTSDAQGEAELVHRIRTGSASSASQCTVLVKVRAGQQSVTRKFRLERK